MRTVKPPKNGLTSRNLESNVESKLADMKQSVEYNMVKWNIGSVLDYVIRQSAPKYT